MFLFLILFTAACLCGQTFIDTWLSVWLNAAAAQVINIYIYLHLWSISCFVFCFLFLLLLFVFFFFCVCVCVLCACLFYMKTFLNILFAVRISFTLSHKNLLIAFTDLLYKL